MQSLMISWRSIPSSFESSSGVRWFDIAASFEQQKSPLAEIAELGSKVARLSLRESTGPLPKVVHRISQYSARVTSAMNISRLDEVRQGGLRVFVGGEGRPVLLLHGLGGAARNWERIARELTARHRVVAPDLPGHGGSEPLAGGAGLEAFVECLDALLSGLRAAPALVAGHSFGAQLGLALAARRPELVRGLLA